MNNELLPNIVSFLQMILPFSQLPKIALNDIAKTIDILLLGPEESLPQSDDSMYLYIVRSGVIQQNNLDGTLRAKLGTEDIFGFSFQPNETNAGYSIIALESTLLYRFDYHALMAKVNAYPNVLSQLALSLQTRLRFKNTKPNHFSHVQQEYLRPCIDVANTKIAIVKLTDSIKDVAHQMRDIVGVSCAFIVDDTQRLIGMVTDKDMTKRVVAQAVNVFEPIRR